MRKEDVVVERNLSKLHREMGPEISAAMKDKSIIEIMLNADGKVWIDRLGSGMEVLCEMDATDALQMLGTIAHMLGTVVNNEKATVEGELPGDGSRVEGVIPPLVASPTINIRKKASAVFPLTQYVEEGRASEGDYAVLRMAIQNRKNLLVVGGTGTGKTTFCNALLHEMTLICPQHRLVILEDTVELQCAMENIVQMRSNDAYSMQNLLKIAMRQRPDRIIVGEVRGKEALDMLKAWNTGHPGGVCTVHANDARAGLIRVEQLVSEVSQAPMRDLIAEAIDIVVFLRRDPERGPVLEEIVAIKGVRNGEYVFEDVREGSEGASNLVELHNWRFDDIEN